MFARLREQGVLSGEHVGGCVLYEKRSLVEKIAAEEAGAPA